MSIYIFVECIKRSKGLSDLMFFRDGLGIFIFYYYLHFRMLFLYNADYFNPRKIKDIIMTIIFRSGCLGWEKNVKMNDISCGGNVNNGLFQKKKSKQGGWGYTFLNTFLLWLYPYKLQTKQAFIPGNSAKLWHPLEIPRSKSKTHENSTSFPLSTPGNSTSFLIDPWNFHIFFLQ